MKYYSLNDINEMKKNGYEKKTIEKARVIQELAHFHIQNITDAFSGVTLGSGVGLHEARGLDDYETESVLKELSKKDERFDWSKISTKDLNYFYSALSFVDAEGMRFLLPAILISEIKGQYNYDVLFHLTHVSDHKTEQISLFSDKQRRAIRLYLRMLLKDKDYAYERKKIEVALERYFFE